LTDPELTKGRARTFADLLAKVRREQRHHALVLEPEPEVDEWGPFSDFLIGLSG